LGDPGVDGMIILEWIFKSVMGGHGLDWYGSGCGQVAGSSECGDEPSGSIKCGPQFFATISYSAFTVVMQYTVTS
jgi:hypothetical protein